MNAYVNTIGKRLSLREEQLLDEIAAKLTQQVSETEVFTIRWKVV